MNNIQKESSSFRDPSGYVFHFQDEIYRSINPQYQATFDELIECKLYDKLVADKLLVKHELTQKFQQANTVIKPEQVNFISYPYEWCFDQLKEAALCTLNVQMTALSYGMSLKDASAYNVQFHQGRALFIDTLSFEKYQEGNPWVAYKQFVQHFFAPLVLMAKVDVKLNSLLKLYIDGIPLDLASKILSWKCFSSFSIFTHIYLHSKFQQKYSQSGVSATKVGGLSKNGMLGLIDSLKSAINSLKLKESSTEWGDYYTFHNYEGDAFEQKKNIINQMISSLGGKFKTGCDLGANNGEFSRLLIPFCEQVIACDIDPIAVTKNYRRTKEKKETHLLPLIIDLTNPSSSIGWAEAERKSLSERLKGDVTLALALIHHLAISNNLPLSYVAAYFARLTKFLIIEFVPKEDSQVKKLLQSREDIFPGYNLADFKKDFSEFFDIISEKRVPQSERTLLLMRIKT